MLQYCYPRLDVNVSKGVNHLLKSPFSVHPKTGDCRSENISIKKLLKLSFVVLSPGRISVPIDFEELDSFDPFAVPTIR